MLGGSARLLTAVGSGRLGGVVRADLERPGLTLVDVAADDPAFELNVSSVLVADPTGERSVVSMDGEPIGEAAAVAVTRAALAEAEPDVVLLDGHHPVVAIEVATWARPGGYVAGALGRLEQ